MDKAAGRELKQGILYVRQKAHDTQGVEEKGLPCLCDMILGQNKEKTLSYLQPPNTPDLLTAKDSMNYGIKFILETK